VISGELPPSPECREIFSEKQLGDGWRLACRTRVVGSVELEIPSDSILNKGVVALAAADPGGKAGTIATPLAERKNVLLKTPSLEAPVSDMENLRATLNSPNANIPLREIRKLPETLRRNAFEISVSIAMGNVVAISTPTDNPAYVAAVDLGTTTVAASLLDTSNGRRVASSGALNPQVEFGDDVLSRISAQAESEENSRRLAELAVSACDTLIRGLRESAGIESEDIIAVMIAGNTVMQSLLVGATTKNLGEIPFVPPFSAPLTLDASEIGLESVLPSAKTALFPVIGGYVGGDIAAGLISTDFANGKSTAIFVDIGTNGEIVLRHEGRLLAAAAAAGPAFEGARIERGIRASAGAIAGASVENGDLSLDVIGGGAPKGICGSGLIDLVALALGHGIMDETGRILEPVEATGAPEKLKKRLVPSENGATDILVAENGGDRVFLRQKDIRQLQLASGAIRAAMNILMKHAGVSESQLDGIVVAGGFGNFIDADNAKRIGLLPNLPDGKISFVGNASLLGAEQAALDKSAWREAAETARSVENVDISLDPEFQIEFANAMIFPS
jgi:uncharacterized 2Fe-2S/4Fe-4S cluster protein (DUF4445 family)